MNHEELTGCCHFPKIAQENGDSILEPRAVALPCGNTSSNRSDLTMTAPNRDCSIFMP